MFRDHHHLGWAAIEPKAVQSPEAALTQFPYSKKCFNGRFFEAETKEVKLREDSPVAFEQVLEFAYRSKCRIIVPPKDPILNVSKEASDQVYILLKTYILADKLCMESLSNHLIDLHKSFAHYYEICGGELAFLTTHGPPGNKMREFPLQQAAWEVGVVGRDAYRKRSMELFDSFVDLSVESALAVTEKAFRIRRADGRPAKQASACRWHIHLTTPKCEEQDGADGADGETTAEKRQRVD
jgi:hypothetical protein